MSVSGLLEEVAFDMYMLASFLYGGNISPRTRFAETMPRHFRPCMRPFDLWMRSSQYKVLHKQMIHNFAFAQDCIEEMMMRQAAEERYGKSRAEMRFKADNRQSLRAKSEIHAF